jgi:acetate kinase
MTVNCGASSIKFEVFSADGTLQRIIKGAIERIGRPDCLLTVSGTNPSDNFTTSLSIVEHSVAVNHLIEWIECRFVGGSLIAIGHRVVHAGHKYWLPQRVTPALIEDIRQIALIDPEHAPQEILLLDGFLRRFPHMVQVACFDTEFHHHMPRMARLLPLPRRYDDKGVRRYGFHGISYAYLLDNLGLVAGAPAAHGRIIMAHLGSGASMAAVMKGQCVDTTMGFTPAAGLMMGTRSGDIDPGLVQYFSQKEGMSPAQFDRMVNHESGLLGVSETSSDIRELLAREAHDVRAAEAVALFCYQAKKWIGAFAAVLGGLDSVIFSGGIGESAASIRARVCEGLGFLGIEISAGLNDHNAHVISTTASRVMVRVMHTDEALMIARATCRVLGIAASLEKKPENVNEKRAAHFFGNNDVTT